MAGQPLFGPALSPSLATALTGCMARPGTQSPAAGLTPALEARQTEEKASLEAAQMQSLNWRPFACFGD